MARAVGSPYRLQLSGQRFGKWLVIERLAGSMWFCRCDCGVESFVSANMMKLGKSTGCKVCASTKHGMEGTKIYNVWAGMKQRCQNEKAKMFEYYGGRGIKVCEAWQKFENFYADMGKPPRGKSLGRKDNDGNYEPSNCRWETPKQQMRNRSNTSFVTFNGETRSLGQWAEIVGVAHGTLKRRYQRGLTPEKILAPVK